MATTTYKAADRASSILKFIRAFLRHWTGPALLLLAIAVHTDATPPQPRFVPGRILIRPKAGLSETNLTGKLQRQGAIHRRTLPRLNVRVLAVPEQNAEAVLAALRSDPEIEFAERDYLAEAAFTANDPYVVAGNEWHLPRIQAAFAWNFTAGRSDTVVAVLDSGVNAAQPDLAGQLLAGYDFVNDDSDPSDDFGHGTAVAGTVAAAGNNGRGVAGVAFGCRVLPVKVVDASGFATYSCIAQGIRYAVDQGARVINISIAGSSPSLTLQDAVDYAWNHNVIIVAAAGNYSDATPQFPAACVHVVGVSATEPDDTLAAFSSYGNDVALSAPGDGIWTTQRDPANPYGAWRGTSFASPIVAGVAALVVSENPSLSNARVVSLLEQTADDAGATGYDTSFGFGRVNAFRAVTAASAEPGALPPAPPPVNSPANEPPPPILDADTNAPFVAIASSPRNGARLTASQIVLAGTARDDVGIAEVQVRVNGAAQSTEGTTNWSAQILLSPGLNTVAVRSVDFAGNVSVEAVRELTCIVNAPLSVQTNGIGAVKPDLDGALLEIGRVYTVKAVPGKGQAFAGWNGIDSASRVLSFPMQSNLVLVANFVPSPFPAVKGNYAGLLAGTNGVAPESSGYFALTTTASGRFTGRILLAGNHLGFHGQVDLAGNAIVSVKRGRLNPLTLTLHVDLANGSDQVSGRVSDGGWTAELSGDRDVFHSRRNPAPQAGSRSFVLERAGDAAAAATGSSTISTGGATRVKGRLNDGRAFSAGSLLAKNGDYPLYLSLKRGSEVVIGWLNFPATPEPAASGTVLWVRTGTNAFTATLQAASAP